METIFFKVYSIIWGIVLIGLRLLIQLIPEKWNDFELNRIYTKKKPKWVWALGLAALTIVTFTWYKELTTDVNYSIILTVLITITLIKVYQIIFNYQKFRNFVIKALIEDRSIITKINITTALLGIILIFMGSYLY